MDHDRYSVGIESGTNHLLVRQIAGLIARRIITDSKQGEHVKQGERMGLIRFGSRVDVFLPVCGWTADRFGARTVFRGAIIVFMLGSIGCALSGSLTLTICS